MRQTTSSAFKIVGSPFKKLLLVSRPKANTFNISYRILLGRSRSRAFLISRMASTASTQAGGILPRPSITFSTNRTVAASRILPITSKTNEPQDKAIHENENEGNLKSAKERKYESMQTDYSDIYHSETY